MDLFRGVLKIGEKSERVLQLTEDLLELNPANYTIWLEIFLFFFSISFTDFFFLLNRQYRRQVLFELQLNLFDELDYIDTFAEENPKNYQLWYHRRVIIERLNNPSRELGFTAIVFQVDSKNYHAWAYRLKFLFFLDFYYRSFSLTKSLLLCYFS